VCCELELRFTTLRALYDVNYLSSCVGKYSVLGSLLVVVFNDIATMFQSVLNALTFFLANFVVVQSRALQAYIRNLRRKISQFFTCAGFFLTR